MIHFVNVVWGEEYTNVFLRACLPNHLSSGNLGSFDTRGDYVYRLYTSSTDAETIRLSGVFGKLQATVQVDLVEVADLGCTTVSSYSGDIGEMTRCHQDAVLWAREARASIVFLAPDVVFSDGAFARLAELATKNVSLVVIPGIRVAKETFLPEFVENFYDPVSHSAAIPARSLARLTCSHLHGSEKARFWDQPQFFNTAGGFRWHVPHCDGFIQHNFYCHPLMVTRIPDGVELSGCNDGQFVNDVAPDFDGIYFIADSDEILCTEMTGRQALLHAPGPINERSAAAWAVTWTTPAHRHFIRSANYVHSGDLTAEWGTVADSARNTVENILREYEALLEDLRTGLFRTIPGDDDASSREGGPDTWYRLARTVAKFDWNALMRVAEIVVRLPVEIADSIVEILYETSGAGSTKTAALTMAVAIAPRLSTLRLLRWTSALYEHGLQELSPLIQRATTAESAVERARAAAAALGAFDDQRACDPFVAAVGQVDASGIEALREEVALLAPRLLDAFERALNQTVATSH